MSSPRGDDRFICGECTMSEEVASIPFLATSWEKLEDVDWSCIVSNYDLLGRDLLRLFAATQGNDPAYGIVFQLSQDAILDIHINTQAGITLIPAKMRQIANWGSELTDDGWREKVGLWYTPSWKYDALGCSLKSEFAAIDDFHYRLFETLRDSPEPSGQEGLLASKIDEARLEAIESILSSPEFAAIPKTADFRNYIADDEGLEYHTKQHLGS